MKTARQRQKPAAVSSAAYKRWEKAAIAGVSLVADAAEHLERTTNDKEVEHDQSAPGQRGFDAVGEVLPPVPTFSQNMFVKSNVQTSTKLKLQLFPIDEGTRRALEMDKHNPHLELTLSTRKKISSVLEHLTRKWGNSGIASGELMLFPYSVQRGNLAGHPRWTQDSSVTAADVYEIIGSPPVFRLRYGWFSNTEISSVAFQAPLASCTILGEHNMEVNNRKKQIMDSRPIHAPPPTDHQSEKLVERCKDRSTLLTGNTVVPSSNNAQEEMTRYVNVASNSNLMESSEAAANISWHQRESEDDSIMMPLEEVDDLRISSSTALSTGEWADSLTNISVGDLLADVSQEMDTSCVNPPVSGSSQYPQQIPFSCDSFDAAIAAHISKHQDKTSFQSALVSHAPSIWDAEETCDGFSFQKNPVFHQEVLSSSKIASPGASEQIARINSVGSGCLIEELPNVERLLDDPAHGDLMDDSPSDPHMLDSTAKDLSGLADIYWPDSLGPLDLDIPSSRYHNEDLILSESLSGLKSLIANSVDAFQNCSFFGLDKKEPASTVEARETVSFADFKIGSGV